MRRLVPPAAAAACGAAYALAFGLVHAAVSIPWMFNLFGPFAFLLLPLFASYSGVHFGLAHFSWDASGRERSSGQ